MAGVSPSTKTFTPKQGQYLAYIHLYTRLHRRPPAETDMQEYFRVSPPSVHQMVLTLERAGLIKRQPRTPRSIEVLVDAKHLPELIRPPDPTRHNHCAESLDAMNPTSVYQYRVSYEKVAAWFSAQPGRRAAWRHHIMLEAIDQGRRGYTMAVNAANTAFHLDYWEHIQKRHPLIHMVRPKGRGSKSNWIILKGHDFPKGVNMHHKLDQQVLELGFSGHGVKGVIAVKPDWPDDILPVQKRRTASWPGRAFGVETTRRAVKTLVLKGFGSLAGPASEGNAPSG